VTTATSPDRGYSGGQCSRSLILACASVFLLINPLLHGRDRPKPKDYALIFGTVWGPDDRPLYGVKVTIRRVSDKRARWEVYSNSRGEFEQHVPVGKQVYIIRADTRGYKSPGGTHLQPGPQVMVRIEKNERADTGLHLR
jgi:hypothetical protein